MELIIIKGSKKIFLNELVGLPHVKLLMNGDPHYSYTGRQTVY